MLRSCAELISRLLKSSGPPLVAAKVLVISRLLHKKLSQIPDPPPLLERLRIRLGSLRRRLLAQIDRRMGLVESSSDEPLQSMCAFSLATSSSASDVLRHFLHIRQEAISDKAQDNTADSQGPSRSLQAFFDTVKDVKRLIPTQLSSSLQKLKSKPLLNDQSLQDTIELNLDLHEKRLGDDIRSFAPYIRHDDLSRPDVGKLMQKWNEQTISNVLRQIRTQVNKEYHPKVLVNQRRHLLELWFANQQHIGSEQRFRYVNDLREIFMKRWLALIEAQNSALRGISEMLQEEMLPGSRVGAEQEPAVDLSLWSQPVLAFDPSDGASALRETLMSRLRGLSPGLRELIEIYNRWQAEIENLSAAVESLTTEKWQDDFDAYEEELDDNCEQSTLESTLNEEDPRKLRKDFMFHLGGAFEHLESDLHRYLHNREPLSIQRISLALHSLRHIKQHLPKPYADTSAASSFGISIIGKLHGQLATAVIPPSLDKSSLHINKALSSINVPSKPLWEGDPPLPNLPSAWVFRLLQDVHQALAGVGSDIWSPAAVAHMKQTLRREISSLVQEHMKKIAGRRAKSRSQKSLVNGTTQHKEPLRETSSDEESLAKQPSKSSTDVLIQLFFDIMYLSHATSPSMALSGDSSSVADLDAVADELVMLRTQLESETRLDATQTGRMSKSAEEYWRRTSLLFGFLVV